MAQGRAATKHRGKLTTDERQELAQLVRRGRAAGWKLRRAQVLLKCDEGEGGPAWPDARIAEALEVTTRSLEHWRRQAGGRGPLSLLGHPPQDRRKGVAVGRCGCWPMSWWCAWDAARVRGDGSVAR